MGRLSATWKALKALWMQGWLWLDQGGNCIGLGSKAVVMAALIGEEQGICYADETLSAHAYRAAKAKKPWAKFWRPLVDKGFFWQKTEPLVDHAAGKRVTGHCERAFWKKKLRLGLPPEYRD